MDGPRNSTPEQPTFWRWVLLLMVIALGLRVWVVARSEVAARDSINFIQYALRFENEPFTKVLREAEQPPGYPLAILAASWPVRAWRGATDPATMVLAAQCASVFFGVLLVVPMALLGRELVGPRTGLIAAALFQCLPSWIRLTSDGLSESTFLFWSATAMWLAARSFATSRPLAMLGCGLATGCAYFTRPEGAEIVLAAGIVLVAAVGMGQIAWTNARWQLLAMIVGFAVFLAPFYATTGRLTNKPTARYLMGEEIAKKAYFSAAPSKSLPLAVWWDPRGDMNGNKWLFALRSLAQEVTQSSRYVGLILAIAGIYLWRSRGQNPLASWMLLGLCIAHAALLVRMTSSLGYLSERHTALLMLVGSFPAALALDTLAQRWHGVRISGNAIAATCVALGLMSACPTLAKGLHANRAGHRAAGVWLAKHAEPTAGICDPFCWANYYAGRVFHETAANDPDEQYVILETGDNQHSRLPLMPEAKAKASQGELVYSWPEKANADKSQVRVYHWRRQQSPITAPNASRTSPPISTGG